MDQHKLKIIHLNINSLRSVHKRQELSHFLNTEKPDILMLNETKLNNSHKVSFRNYNFIRNDRPNNKGGGGTGILIRDSLNFQQLTLSNLNSIECTVVNLQMRNQKELLIASVYVAKDLKNTIDVQDFDKILSLKNSKSQFIMGGDFNAHHPLWKSNLISPNGRAIYDWFSDKFCVHSIVLACPLFPSRHCNDNHSFLDFFFVSSSFNVNYPIAYSNHLQTIPFESDHDAVVLEIYLDSAVIPLEKIILNNFGNTNWKKFNQKLDENIESIVIPTNYNISNEEIDSILSQITSTLQRTIDNVVPKITLQTNGQIPLPNHIIKIIKFKNKLRRALHAKNYCHTEFTLKSQIKCLNVMVKKLIILHYNKYYEAKLSNIKPDHNLYKNLKKFSGYKLKSNFTPCLINENNTKFVSTIEKANGLGLYFENVHKKTLNIGDAAFCDSINTIINNEFGPNNNDRLCTFSTPQSADQKFFKWHPLEEHLLDDPFPIQQPIHVDGQKAPIRNNFTHLNLATSADLLDIIKAKNNKKSFGSDGIPNYALKKLSEKFYHYIAITFNHMFNNGYWPIGWKSGIIIPLLKPSKDPGKIDSYRPITLLSCLSKIFETWILIKIRNHCSENNIIPNDQFGFRPKHSTLHALTKFSHDISYALNNKTPTIGCALDCEKAFDTTWVEGLIYKLKYLFGIHDHICKLLFSYLSDRTFQVKIENVLSDVFKIAAGVPQGSVLAPILYVLFIADLPAPPSNHIKKITFADDILVYFSTQNVTSTLLNKYLQKIHEHLQLWKINLNISKCEAIVIKGSYNSVPRKVNKQIKNIRVKINAKNIPINNSIKYLGIIFSRNFQFFDHIKNIISKLFKAFIMLKHIFYAKKRYTPKIKSILYKQLLRPIIMYGFPIWHNISSAQMEKLRIEERKILRACAEISRKPGSYLHINNNALYSSANTERLDRMMVSHARAFFQNFDNTENPLVTSMLEDCIAEYHLNDLNIFKSPLHLKCLLDTNTMFDDNGNLIFYHRRKQGNGNDLVYNINQNTTP